jgi:hypothetical protein
VTKKSMNRRMKDMRAAGVAPAPRQPFVPVTAGLHPLLQQRLEEVKKQTAEIVGHDYVPVWDELENVYQKMLQGVMAPAVLGTLAQRKDLIVFVRDKKGLVTRIQMFQREILAMKEELKEIHAQHAGKVGGTDDPDVVMNANMINEQYILFGQRMEAIITPTVAHILEIFTEAEVLQAQAHGKLQTASESGLTPEQDPAVITDVVETNAALEQAAAEIVS